MHKNASKGHQQIFEVFLLRFAADAHGPSSLGIKKNNPDRNVQFRLAVFRRNQAIELDRHGFGLDHLLEREQEKEMALADVAVESSNNDLRII